jgi:hypothetical protein
MFFLTINKKKYSIFSWNRRKLASLKSRIVVLNPCVHAACFLVDSRASSPDKGRIFRITFWRHIQCTDFQLELQTDSEVCQQPDGQIFWKLREAEQSVLNSIAGHSSACCIQCTVHSCKHCKTSSEMPHALLKLKLQGWGCMHMWWY